MKKITSIILSVIIILNIFCGLSVVSASSLTSGYYEYKILEDGTAEITRYTGSETALIIPSELNRIKVTSIGESAFYRSSGLTRVTIPDSVTSIGYDAFSFCTSLTSVTISNSVTSIGANTFAGCTSLKSIAIPDSVKSIGNCAFSGCSRLKSIAIPDNVKIIGNLAFCECISLTSITIPDSVTSLGNGDIGGGPFFGCTSLNYIIIPDSIKRIVHGTFSGTAYYNNPDNWENDVLYIGKHLIEAKDSLSGEYNIKSGTLTIADYAFCGNYNYETREYENSITGVTIPDSVTSIGKYAFYDCSKLKSVIIGNRVTSIGENAFEKCTSLESVKIYDIAAWCNIVFKDNDSNPLCYAQNLYLNDTLVTDLTIPDRVTSIGTYAFSGCKNIKSVIIGNRVTSIGENAFEKCTSLESVKIYDIAAWCNIVFKDNDSNPLCYAQNLYLNDTLVTDLTIPDRVTSIGTYAFSGCKNIKSVTIPDSVTSIGGSAFSGCANLKYITIPNTTSYIGMQAFYNCSSLESISLPEGITSIYNYTFYGCNNLNYAFYNGYKSNLSIGSYNEPLTRVIKYTKDKGTFNSGEWNFDYATGVLRITGNSNMEFGYNQTIPWSEYKYDIKSVVIESGITSIADYAFACYTNLSSVIIPNTVTNIGDGAFTDCTSLKNVDLSSSLSAIGDYAFSNCTSLESITIPKCDSTLGQSAFSYCSNLKTVEITYGLPGIESSAFYGCSSITTISIPDSVKSIGEEAFNDCQSLTSVTIGTGCKSISSKAFWDCPKLNKITVKYPNCIFDDSQYTISTTAVICGYKNSTAYTYARSYMRSFEDIETGIRYGWIDGSFIEIPTEIDPTDPTDPISSESWVVVKAPTCDEIGVEVNYATQNSRIIPALGHDYSNEFTIDKEATCAEDGLKSKHCSRCDSTTEKTIIPKTSHRPSSEWIVVKEATTTEEGLEEKHCIDCGTVLDSREIPIISIIIGDVNGDKVVDILDATMIQKFAVEKTALTDDQKEVADVNDDGVVDILDASDIQKFTVEKITEFKKK